VAIGNVDAILTSFDGKTWTVQSETNSKLNRLTYGNGTFETVGWYGTIL